MTSDQTPTTGDSTGHDRFEQQRERLRLAILEQIATGQRLTTILESIVRTVEQEFVDCRCSILLLDKTGRRLQHGAAPSLPEFYNQAVHGVEIGPGVGSCGTAAYTNQRVIVADVESHPYWAPYRDLARQAGFRACWSEPIVSSTGKVLGTFALYHALPHTPTDRELDSITQSALLASIAIERMQAEEEVLNSQRMLRMVLDNIPQGVFWKDRDSRYLGCNRVVAQAFGLDAPERIIGLNDYQLLGLTPEQADFFIAKDREVMVANRPQLGIIEQATLADGSRIWMETNKVPMLDAEGRVVGVLGTWQDITERKRAEEILRASQQKLTGIAATMPQILYVFDILDQSVVYSNRETWQDLGYSAEEAAQFGPQGVMTLLHPDDQARLPQLLARWDHAAVGDVLEVEYRLLDHAGQWRWYLGRETIYQRDAQGRVREIIGTMQDITERKQAEEERRRLDAQLQHTQKLESLGVLAGGIAHDFNNLLTGILGYSDLALRELSADSPARHFIHEAVNGARRAAELTRQMLAYSGKGRFVVQPLNLSALTEDLFRLLEISISKKCVMKFNLMPNLPAIEADPAQVRQIIMNLIINASEAIGEQSGVIAVTTGVRHCDREFLAETSLTDLLPAGLYVYLEVADTGSGMDAETRAKIFDPFFTTKFTGRGLGLSAVLGIVRGHRGTIRCSSELGKGTTFQVFFPATPLAARALESRPTGEADWRGRGSVLVIDDEQTVRSLARQMLEEMGFTVWTAADGQEGLDVFRTRGEEIRLVLLDMTMPRLDGEETFRELRRLRDDVRVILSSGFNEQIATSRFAGQGLAAFLQKPYRFEELLAVVRKVLQG